MEITQRGLDMLDIHFVSILSEFRKFPFSIRFDERDRLGALSRSPPTETSGRTKTIEEVLF